MRTTNFRARRPLLGAALLLAGCATAPRRSTTAWPRRGAGAAPACCAAAGAAPPYIELAPVAMPERFARPQMVVRQEGRRRRARQVDILEQHRWSSSFENELRDALGSGIASRLGAVDVTKSGRQRGQPATRIAVQLRQFDAVEGSRVDASFSWTLRRTRRRRRDRLPALAVGAGRAAASTRWRRAPSA